MKGLIAILIWLWIAANTFAAVGRIHDNPVLLLIQPALAGPNVQPDSYWHPTWVLWPPTTQNTQGGQLVSVATGANWAGNSLFYQATNIPAIRRRGFFRVRNELLDNIRTDLLLNGKGGASNNALLLSMSDESGKVHPYFMEDEWPKGSLMVGEVAGWEDVDRLEGLTSSRILVVEYPPVIDSPWTRFWLRGAQWPHQKRSKPLLHPTLPENAVVPFQVQVPVPGLIKAANVVSLVAHPDRFQWQRVDQKSYPAPNRFLEQGHTTGSWFSLGWMLIAGGLAGWGVWLVSNERSSRVLPTLLRVILLSPASVVVAGQIEQVVGMAAWSISLFLSILVLASGAELISWKVLKYFPRTHPLVGVFLVSALTLSLIDPIWSFTSPVFGGRVWDVSPVAFAAWIGSVTGVVLSVEGIGTKPQWIVRIWLMGMLTWLALGSPWWKIDFGAALFGLTSAWVIGERRFRWPMLSVCIAWPTALVQLLRFGFSWTPVGLLLFGRDLRAINAFEWFEFLMSWGFLSLCFLCGAILIFGYRFFLHQIRSVVQLDLRRKCLPVLAVSMAAAGVLQPVLLYGSMTIALGAIFMILFDAIQTM